MTENTIITPSMLKYGLCSYFALAYNETHPTAKIIVIMEYDSFVNKSYLVHMVVEIPSGKYLDSMGTYDTLTDSTNDITDIEFMTLSHKEETPKNVRTLIELDIGFDQILYENIKTYVQNHNPVEKSTEKT